MTINVTTDGTNTLESNEAYCAPARTMSSRVEGSSATAGVNICSGMRRENRYHVTARLVKINGATHATKIPWSADRKTQSGRRANFAIEYAMFSTATHFDARSPIKTESCRAKIVQRTTETMNNARQMNADGKKLCPKSMMT